MDEVWLRVGLVAGALVIALVAGWTLRSRADQPVRNVGQVNLPVGPHFFSSTDCGSCRKARRELSDALGSDGFVEHVWEESPGVFSEIGVTAVPAVLLVAPSQQATLYPGRVERALRAL